MASGVVFVGEDFDDEMYMWPGRWSAHWESDDGQQWRQGPEGVSAQEAIAWGREHADVVLIRPGDSDTHYSAGRRVPESDASSDYPAWPDGQELPRRRAAGRDYVDRSPDASPIVWRVCAGADLPIASLAEFVNDYVRSLRSDDAVVDVVTQPRVVGSGHFECEFTVRAVTIDAARKRANDVWDRAMAAGLKGLPTGLPDSGWTASMSDPEPLDWPSDGSA